MEYVSKSKDGIDFSNSNVDNDSAHYLYSKSFDDIYISINYNPSSKGELYANITFDYSIRSSGIHESMKIKYNENCSIVTLYQSVLTELSVEIMMLYLENMILNYVV